MKTILRKIIVIYFLITSQNISAQVFEPLEPIYGYIPARDGIFFQVVSAGCTTSDDFVVQIQRTSTEDSFTLIREHFDYCKAYVPYGTTIYKSYDELGVLRQKPYRISNPIRSLRRIR